MVCLAPSKRFFKMEPAVAHTVSIVMPCACNRTVWYAGIPDSGMPVVYQTMVSGMPTGLFQDINRFKNTRLFCICRDRNQGHSGPNFVILCRFATQMAADGPPEMPFRLTVAFAESTHEDNVPTLASAVVCCHPGTPGTPTCTLVKHVPGIQTSCIVKDNVVAVVTQRAPDIRIVDCATGNCSRRLVPPVDAPQTITSLAVSPDGGLVASVDMVRRLPHDAHADAHAR